MSTSEEKVLRYLDHALASEQGLVRILQSQIPITPRGRYRTALESHLEETRKHVRRLTRRMQELGTGRNPLRAIVGLAEGTISQVLALGKAPWDLIRGTGGEEKILENAKDTCATEAREIATYTALERFATAVSDDTTAKLAASIRAEEEKMLDRLLREIPRLTDAVVRVEVNGGRSDDLADTGAPDAVRDVGAAAEVSRGAVELRARRRERVARQARGAARAKGQIKGLMASAEDLPIPNYDKLAASEVAPRLRELSQIDLAKVSAYERRYQKRTTVLTRITALTAEEPWPGYDELTAGEIRTVLDGADEDPAERVYAYERAHKNRSGVLETAAREGART